MTSGPQEKRWPLVLGLFIWLALVTLGWWGLMRHESAAGKPAVAPPEWPRDSALTPDQYRPTVVLLAHPHCPCTRATMEELSRLLTQCRELSKVYLVLSLPGAKSQDWAEGPIKEAASILPEVEVFIDSKRTETRRFGAYTSGQVLAYAPDGRLLFSGGLTGSRGHAGDNAGRDALVALLREQTDQFIAGAVYGCPLLETELDFLGVATCPVGAAGEETLCQPKP